MRLFRELAQLAFRRQLTYRAATLAGLATNIFFGLLRATVFIALFGAQVEVAGYTVQDAITYTALSQAVIAFLSIFGSYEIMDSIYTGQVSTDLLKPLSYYRFWLALDMGRAVAALLLRGLPILLVYGLVVDLTVPQGLAQWTALAVSLALAWLVSFSWRYLVNLSALWTPNARGVGRFAFGMAWVLSGFYMPLRFFPDWFVTLCNLTPFPSMVNTSVEVYLGLVAGPDLLWALAQQALWATALILAGQVALRAGVRRLVIQGG